jgi:hypothetical protein
MNAPVAITDAATRSAIMAVENGGASDGPRKNPPLRTLMTRPGAASPGGRSRGTSLRPCQPALAYRQGCAGMKPLVT